MRAAYSAGAPYSAGERRGRYPDPKRGAFPDQAKRGESPGQAPRGESPGPATRGESPHRARQGGPPDPARRPAPQPLARQRADVRRDSLTGPVPASGAWRPGDPPGRREFVDLGSLNLEAGGRLPHVRLAYETWGTLNPGGDNAVLVLHALTGDSHVVGDVEPGHPSPGWWAGLVGPGLAIDTDRYFVVAPNVLGGCQGSTGPASDAPDGTPWGSRFPYLTVRDQVAAEIELADRLGIGSWAAVLGGSIGGHRVLEWALLAPERVNSVITIASNAQTSGDQIAWAHAQIGAIRADPRYRGGDYYGADDDDGPHLGLGVARQIAHTTYRSAQELDERFGRIPQGGEDPLGGQGRFAVQSYLDHHGSKLARRFDANSYVVLTQAMLNHDVGRDRGGVASALAEMSAPVLSVGVDSDRLFLPEQALRIAQSVPEGTFQMIYSDHGHDGFLIETDQLGTIVSEFLGN